MKELVKEQEEKAEEKKLTFAYEGRKYQNQDDIAYFSNEMLLNKFQDKLLGTFSKEGLYSLPKEILSDLVSMKKVVSKKEGEVLYVKAETSAKTFNFIVKTELISNSKMIAHLYFVENVTVLGIRQNEILSPVASYTDTIDAFFEAKYKKVFNIVLVADGGKEENNILAKALLEKIKFMDKIFQRYLTENYLKDKIYVEKLLKVLANDPKGAKFIKTYEGLLEKYAKHLNPKSADYHRNLKNLLDRLVENAGSQLTVSTLDHVKNLRNAYLKANMSSFENISAEETAKAAKSAKPKEAVKGGKGNSGGGAKGNSKSGGGKSSGGPAKAAPKKDGYVSDYYPKKEDKTGTEKEQDKKEPSAVASNGLDMFLGRAVTNYVKKIEINATIIGKAPSVEDLRQEKVGSAKTQIDNLKVQGGKERKIRSAVSNFLDGANKSREQ